MTRISFPMKMRFRFTKILIVNGMADGDGFF